MSKDVFAALRCKITILEPTYDDNAGDQRLKPIEEWNIVATVWAAYRDLSGREFFAARQVQAELTGEFKIRYRKDIKPHYKIKWGERIFEIAAPPRDIDGKRQWLYINVVERV